MHRLMRTAGVLTAVALCSSGIQAAGKIIHDGEYKFLEAQHGDKWAVADINIAPLQVKKTA
mgnify:CR=1 FL=1